MTMFQPAERVGINALVLFYGPSGCGKTFSAILAARGLVGPKGKIAFLDTEAGRGTHYAHLTDYDITQMAPPYSAGRYLEIVDAAEAAGYDALIIDSISHEWEGEGGVLEQAENIELDTGKPGLQCWARPKQAHKKLINRILRSKMHIIFCARAREKPKQVKGNRGRSEIVSDGFEPIVEKSFPFEMLISVGMNPEHPGIPDFTMKHKKVPGELAPAFPEGKHVGIQTGDFIRLWLGGAAPVDPAFVDAAEAGREAARGGQESLNDWWRGLDKPEKTALQALVMSEMRSIATAVEESRRIMAEARTTTAPKRPGTGERVDPLAGGDERPARDINEDKVDADEEPLDDAPFPGGAAPVTEGAD